MAAASSSATLSYKAEFLGVFPLPQSQCRPVISSYSFPSTNRVGSTNRRFVTRAASEGGGDDEIVKEKEPSGSGGSMISLEDVNPVGLGRRSRQIFDEVWRKFSGLGQISRTVRTDDEEALDLLGLREGGPMCEFAIPGAQNTTVLVVGATSSIGRIVVRKLMLRGYTVKALVRKFDSQVVDMLPRSVEIVTGDVGDPSTLKDAVEGCNKVIYCATARSPITADLYRVDHRGVYNLSKALQVPIILSSPKTLQYQFPLPPPDTGWDKTICRTTITS